MGKLRALAAMSIAGLALCAGFADGALPVEVYGKLPAIENPHLSPDGSMLA